MSEEREEREGEEERERLRGKEGYKRMKRENKSDNDPKWKSKNVLRFFFFFFYIWEGQEEEWKGWEQDCWCIAVSRENVRAFRYQSVSQTQSPWIHTHTHIKRTHLVLKIEAKCQGEIQLSAWKLESVQDVSASVNLEHLPPSSPLTKHLIFLPSSFSQIMIKTRAGRYINIISLLQ